MTTTSTQYPLAITLPNQLITKYYHIPHHFYGTSYFHQSPFCIHNYRLTKANRN